MATLLLFASARQAAGVAKVDIEAGSVAAVLAVATERFGPEFAKVVSHSKIWCNGEPADLDMSVSGTDEIAVLPPVSGG